MKYYLDDEIKGVEMDRHVAMHGETRQEYKLLVGSPARVRPLGTPMYEWEDNIKMDFK
jgi:hypothetical protein